VLEIVLVLIGIAAGVVAMLLMDPAHEACQPVKPVKRIGGDE
jgi:hypothetical protein